MWQFAYAAPMRELGLPPYSVIDAAGPSGVRLRTGSFRGPLPPVDLSPLGLGPLARLVREKRWIYVALATDELLIGAAIVRLGYAANAFAFVLDRASGKLLVDRTAMGLPSAASVGDGLRAGARFQSGRSALHLASPDDDHLRFTLALPQLELEAELSLDAAPPPISAIVDLSHLARPGAGRVGTTEKRALVPMKGQALVAGRRYSLDEGLAGTDYTCGYLPRHTAWHWAFALGHARGGERVALNLVEGFNGEPECAVWVDDAIFPVGEGRFTFEREHHTWRVESACGAVQLDFQPDAVHAERRDLGLVRSRFIQPLGNFRGELRLPGRGPLQLDRVAGVCEDQDVLW